MCGRVFVCVLSGRKEYITVCGHMVSNRKGTMGTETLEYKCVSVYVCVHAQTRLRVPLEYLR